MSTAPINTRAGKRKFINNLTRSIAKDLIAQIDRMPVEWDGHELRELIAMEAVRERGQIAVLGPRRAAFERVCLTDLDVPSMLPGRRSRV